MNLKTNETNKQIMVKMWHITPTEENQVDLNIRTNEHGKLLGGKVTILGGKDDYVMIGKEKVTEGVINKNEKIDELIGDQREDEIYGEVIIMKIDEKGNPRDI